MEKKEKCLWAEIPLKLLLKFEVDVTSVTPNLFFCSIFDENKYSEKLFSFFELDFELSFRTYLKDDLFAGYYCGCLLIPQGMAYALIAGLPPIYGLYAALTPQIIYAFLGTSRQLAVGPVAMDSY